MFKSIFVTIAMLTAFTANANQCVDDRIANFYKQEGPDASIHYAVLEEWNDECGVVENEEPRNIELKIAAAGDTINIQSKEDYLIVTGIELNRGNCKVSPIGQPPFELKFGVVKTIMTYAPCNLIELKLEIDGHVYTWDVY